MSESLRDVLLGGFEHGRFLVPSGHLDGEGELVEIAYSKAGSGPPLLLVHGYPQTRLMWHRVAPALAERFTVVLPDLRGYGESTTPHSPDGALYSKGVMAADLVALMDHLGFARFHLAGHDRGARVSYRLALTYPDRVSRLAVLDILPTSTYFDAMDKDFGMKAYHWLFLAQPYPLPERLIAADPAFYIRWTIESWTPDQAARIDPRAMEAYCTQNATPEHVHAMCGDYRAGATVDYAADKADLEAGRKIAAPVLALWGGRGLATKSGDPLEGWRPWADDVRGESASGGHFVAEEDPETVLLTFRTFFPDTVE